ncbi:MAG: hypothetical protein ACXAC6_01550 [Candidatus Hodarchaeales archaeon]
MYSPTYVSATVIWEENFENGPYDDWTLDGYKEQNGLLYSTNNSPSIENGRLNMLTTSYPYGIAAIHNSTVAYGTWSFDWIVPSKIQEEAQVGYFFAGNFPVYLNGSDIEPPTLNTYLLYMESIFESLDENCFNITIGEYNYGNWQIIKEETYSDPLTGLIHIDITRDMDGTIKVFTNSSSKPFIEIVNNRIKTSERVCFWSWYGESAIDNVVVYSSEVVTEGSSGAPAFTFEVLLLILPLSIIYTRKRRR